MPTTNVRGGRERPRRPGLYERRIFPRVLDAVMDTEETRRIRAQVCAPLRGEVLEVGFGTGLNLPFLPAGVRRLHAVDPLEAGRARAAARLAGAPCEVVFAGLDGEALALDDGSVDAVLCTWALCSIPDPVAAVREIRRVLRPGGALHFVEHGLSPDERVRRWQRRLRGVQQRFACGCTTDRDIPALLDEGGMEVVLLDTYYAKGDPKFLGWTFEGLAVAAARSAADPVDPGHAPPLAAR